MDYSMERDGRRWSLELVWTLFAISHWLFGISLWGGSGLVISWVVVEMGWVGWSLRKCYLLISTSLSGFCCWLLINTAGLMRFVPLITRKERLSQRPWMNWHMSFKRGCLFWSGNKWMLLNTRKVSSLSPACLYALSSRHWGPDSCIRGRFEEKRKSSLANWRARRAVLRHHRNRLLMFILGARRTFDPALDTINRRIEQFLCMHDVLLAKESSFWGRTREIITWNHSKSFAWLYTYIRCCYNGGPPHKVNLAQPVLEMFKQVLYWSQQIILKLPSNPMSQLIIW